ncbi:AraC family transcriptional regulator [Shimia haliotis]|uniref:Transcriptional regulator, AraC family n=1 Tax=Shimia haliotis TaxID=1280847 RepID=A0A1I4CHZ0_9RHOB|nr:AraC family transcriptional regulator [Shimia haliotis]SFK79899.1 transcriptional regulator, AraC family [Shimia haliotis]
MSKDQIREILDRRLQEDGLVETAINGVQLFRVTSAMPCVPAVYEPSVVAIVSGAKEAVLDGARHVYDSERYMCCSMSMPAEAGTPEASPETPLLGVSVSLDTRVMTELAIEMENAPHGVRTSKGGAVPQGVALARWDVGFSDALLRLVQLTDSPADAAMLGAGRLRELYFAVLKGEAGESARRAFGVGNEIARSIAFLSTRLDETVTIDTLASEVGMSRAVFHRKFKQATTMSPIQFVKSMRLNSAAMKIAQGAPVSTAAMDVGYLSASQFSREFKRAYGQSPKQWSQNAVVPEGVV